MPKLSNQNTELPKSMNQNTKLTNSSNQNTKLSNSSNQNAEFKIVQFIQGHMIKTVIHVFNNFVAIWPGSLSHLLLVPRLNPTFRQEQIVFLVYVVINSSHSLYKDL
jgi:hypothetical protein